jgi:hypothetical protein
MEGLNPEPEPRNPNPEAVAGRRLPAADRPAHLLPLRAPASKHDDACEHDLAGQMKEKVEIVRSL